MIPKFMSHPGRIQVIGADQHFLGGKMQAFVDHASAIERAGFQTTPKFILPGEGLDNLLRHNHVASSMALYKGSYYQLVKSDLTWPEELSAAIDHVSQKLRLKFGDNPLVIRSSGQGDVTGMGVYKSYFTANQPDIIRSHILRILLQFYQREAQVWREATGHQANLAIGIEPVVGQHWNDVNGHQAWGPMLSGMAYSLTYTGEPFIKLQLGLGGGSSQKITRQILDPFEYSALRYIESQNPEELHSKTATLNALSFSEEGHDIYDEAEVTIADIRSALAGVELRSLFDKLQSLEAIIGLPAYIEWAINLTSNGPQVFVNQIAPLENKTDQWVYGSHKEPLLVMYDVRRGAHRDVSAILYADDASPEALDLIREYNLTHQDHLIVYGDQFNVSNFRQRKVSPLEVSHVSNAAGMMMAPRVETGTEWEEHLRGLAQSMGLMVGKDFVLVPDVNESFYDQVEMHFDRIGGGEFDMSRGVYVYERPMKLLYSSSHRSAVLVLRDSES